MTIKKKRVKLEDIARNLNISIATVSRALDKNPRVKNSTQEKVFNAAKAMGYMPNQIAKSLSSGKTNIIGVIIPRYDEPFFIEVCRGIDDYARTYNYKILISSSRNSFDVERDNLIAFERGLVDGIILSPTHETEMFAHIRSIINKGIPMVLFDNISEQVSGADHILIADDKASFEAVEFLIKKGKKKIAFLGGVIEKKVFQDRYKGYINAMKKHNLTIHQELILHCQSLEREQENDEIQRFFRNMSIQPDGVFACTDNYGLLAMKNLLKAGYKIPEEVSVIGFGDLGLGKIFVPTMTCIAQPTYEMGQKAAALLIEQLNEPNDVTHEKKVIEMKTKLVLRDST